MTHIDPTIKTDKRTAVRRLDPGGKKGPESSPDSVDKPDRVTLSTSKKVPASKTTGGTEIRYDLVNKYKSVLQKGGYRIKADEIAEKMVQKIRDNKGPSIY